MRKIFIVICIASIIISCVDEKQVAIENELEQIEYDLHFYSQQAEIKLDSIIQNFSPQMKDEFDGQLAFLSGLLEYKKGNIDSSLTLLDKSLIKSLHQDNVKIQAKSQMVLGWIAEGTGFWEQAKINYYITIQLLNNTSYKETGWAYLGVARCKKNLKEPFYEEAEQGIRILKEIGKKELVLYADYL